jgi:hypothetical protein
MEILIKCKKNYKTQNPHRFGIVLVSLRVEKESQSTKGCVSVRLNHICLRRMSLVLFQNQECDTYLHTVGGISVIFAAPLENLTGPLESKTTEDKQKVKIYVYRLLLEKLNNVQLHRCQH